MSKFVVVDPGSIVLRIVRWDKLGMQVDYLDTSDSGNNSTIPFEPHDPSAMLRCWVDCKLVIVPLKEKSNV